VDLLGPLGGDQQVDAELPTFSGDLLQAALDKAELEAEKQVAKELDMSVKDVDAAVREAAGEVG
jgi:hypothetical protein